MTREEFRAKVDLANLGAYDSASDEDVAPFLVWTAESQLAAIKGPLRALVWTAWDYGILPRWSMLRANLRFADLSWADLRGSRLRYADFSGANLTYARISRADLTGASFYAANLTGTELHGVEAVDTDFSHANIAGASFCGAHTMGANFWGTDTTKAYGLK